MMRWLKEWILTMGLSLKMLWKGKQTLILLVASLLLLTSMLLSLDSVKEEKSKIAIGMVDKEESDLSKHIIRAMEKKDLYDVLTGEERELLEQLNEGTLSAVCVLKESFSEEIFQGKTKNLVTIYEREDSTALLLGDILAGVMMEEICLSKGYRTLLDYEKQTGKEQTQSLEEYRSFVNAVAADLGTDFFFEVEYVAGTGVVAEQPSQSVVYEQAIFAVFALMAGILSVYSVLPYRRFKSGVAAGRVKTLPISDSALYAGSALAGFLIPMLFGGLFLACLAWKNSLNFSQIISLLICTMGYVCVIVCMMLLAATVIAKETVYQMSMLAMILIFGVFGLVSLVEGLLVPEGMSRWVPNSWFVRKMTELF